MINYIQGNLYHIRKVLKVCVLYGTRLPEPIQEAEFRIVDALGREVLGFASSLSEVTHVVPVFDYAAGIYFLQYFEVGILKQSKEFVVIK